ITAGATKAVEIRGAGAMPLVGSAGQTVITFRGGRAFGGRENTSYSPIIDNVKIIYDSMSPSPADALISFGPTGPNQKPFILHHIDFDISPGHAVNIIDVGVPGAVIYRNRFVMNANTGTGAIPIKLAVGDDGSYWASASTMGSYDNATFPKNVYIEDNYFHNFNSAIDRNSSSRVVFRFNELHNSGLADHGEDSSLTGERHHETYNNDFRCDEV